MTIGVGMAADQELVRAGVAVIVACQEDMMRLSDDQALDTIRVVQAGGESDAGSERVPADDGPGQGEVV